MRSDHTVYISLAEASSDERERAVMRREQLTPPAPSCALVALDAAAAALLAVTTSFKLLPVAIADPTVRRPLLPVGPAWPLPCFSFVLEASDRESSGPVRALDGGIELQRATLRRARRKASGMIFPCGQALSNKYTSFATSSPSRKRSGPSKEACRSLPASGLVCRSTG